MVWIEPSGRVVVTFSVVVLPCLDETAKTFSTPALPARLIVSVVVVVLSPVGMVRRYSVCVVPVILPTPKTVPASPLAYVVVNIS